MNRSAAERFVARTRALSVRQWARIGHAYLGYMGAIEQQEPRFEEVGRAGQEAGEDERAELNGMATAVEKWLREPRPIEMLVREEPALAHYWPQQVEGLLEESAGPFFHFVLTGVAYHDRISGESLRYIYAPFEELIPLADVIGAEALAAADARPRVRPTWEPLLDAERVAALFANVAERVSEADAERDVRNAQALAAALDAASNDDWLGVVIYGFGRSWEATAVRRSRYAPPLLRIGELVGIAPPLLRRIVHRAGAQAHATRLMIRLNARRARVDWSGVGGEAKTHGISVDELKSIAALFVETAVYTLLVRSRLDPRAVELGLDTVRDAFRNKLTGIEADPRPEAAQAAAWWKRQMESEWRAAATAFHAAEAAQHAKRPKPAPPPEPTDARAEALFGRVADTADPAAVANDLLAAEAFVRRLEEGGDAVWLVAMTHVLDAVHYSGLEARGGQRPADTTFHHLAAMAGAPLTRAIERAGVVEQGSVLMQRVATLVERVDWLPLREAGAQHVVMRDEVPPLAFAVAMLALMSLLGRSYIEPRMLDFAYGSFEAAIPLASIDPVQLKRAEEARAAQHERELPQRFIAWYGSSLGLPLLWLGPVRWWTSRGEADREAYEVASRELQRAAAERAADPDVAKMHQYVTSYVRGSKHLARWHRLPAELLSSLRLTTDSVQEAVVEMSMPAGLAVLYHDAISPAAFDLLYAPAAQLLPRDILFADRYSADEHARELREEQERVRVQLGLPPILP